jgi:hypothetical protein
MSGGGGGGPTNSTVTQSNIPDWLRPQVESLLGGATKELFQTQEVPGAIDPETGVAGPSTFEITGTKPFTPYSTNMQDYVAGFSPLQQQVQANAANLQVPGQFGQATGLAGAAGMGGMQSAQQALGYGNAGFQSGQLGQQIGTQGGAYYGGMGAGYGGTGAGYGAQAAELAGQAQGYGQGAADIGQMGLRAEQYGRQISGRAEDFATQAANAGKDYSYLMRSPELVQQFMSPYQQSVTDIQIDAARRQADISRTQRGSQAARAGAFGGARQAIENAEAERALQSQLAAIQAQGSQSAYDRAQQAIQAGMGYELQGVGAANQSLGTALQGGQLGLAGLGTAMQGQQAGLQGLSTANQLYGTGIQGAQAGMQGAQVGLSGVDRQLAGTGQGMQGAQVGLQGVSGAQAGYGLANQAASNLSNIGTAQLGAQTGILGLQNQIGGQQQAQQQQLINQAIQNYAQAQEAPMQAMNQYNALLRGYAMPGQTTTQYQAAPTAASQLLGAGTAAYGLSQLTGTGKAAGGKISSYAKGGAVKPKQKSAGLAELALSKI